MRKTFFDSLYELMGKNENIYALTGDLGYIGFDKIRDIFPDKFINCGASEQTMMDMAVGLAYEGKIPFVYSITPFLIYRPFETLRTYINHEKLNVKLIGSGRNQDYIHDGMSHYANDVEDVLRTLPNIVQYYPESKEEIPNILIEMLGDERPGFLSLRR